jgi:hypothetical protein
MARVVRWACRPLATTKPLKRERRFRGGRKRRMLHPTKLGSRRMLAELLGRGECLDDRTTPSPNKRSVAVRQYCASVVFNTLVIANVGQVRA